MNTVDLNVHPVDMKLREYTLFNRWLLLLPLLHAVLWAVVELGPEGQTPTSALGLVGWGPAGIASRCLSYADLPVFDIAIAMIWNYGAVGELFLLLSGTLWWIAIAFALDRLLRVVIRPASTPVDKSGYHK